MIRLIIILLFFANSLFSQFLYNYTTVSTEESIYIPSFPLSVPGATEGTPTKGERVRVRIDGWSSNLYYVLFLPHNFNNDSTWPVIFESPGNVFSPYSGLPDDCVMGFGLSTGLDYIWVSAPFINADSTQILTSWWTNGNATDDPTPTINFWKAIVHDLQVNRNADTTRITISGFSRGAIADSYVGNWNDNISTYWNGYFAHAHFDGFGFTAGGFADRRARIGSRYVLITCGADDSALTNSDAAFTNLTSNGVTVDSVIIPDLGHSPDWILLDSDQAGRTREWLDTLNY